jgi:hypothetical protein
MSHRRTVQQCIERREVARQRRPGAVSIDFLQTNDVSIEVLQFVPQSRQTTLEEISIVRLGAKILEIEGYDPALLRHDQYLKLSPRRLLNLDGRKSSNSQLLGTIWAAVCSIRRDLQFWGAQARLAG